MIIKNDADVTPEEIIAQMNESRPLPLGVTEFDAWADRIISGALVPADKDSVLFCLCNMLLSLGPTESHKPDAHFIHGLRKFAVNQVAVDRREKLFAAKKAKEAAEKAAKEAEAANLEAEKTLERAKGLSLVPQSSVLDNGEVS